MKENVASIRFKFISLLLQFYLFIDSYAFIFTESFKQNCREFKTLTINQSKSAVFGGGNDHERRSVSDYMGGHHAGKFDFDPRLSGVTSINYEKSLVFDDVIANDRRRVLAPVSNTDGSISDDIPKWSTRKIDLEKSASMREEIDWKATQKAEAMDEDSCFISMILKNDEISWEPFYVTIETISDTNIYSDTGITSSGRDFRTLFGEKYGLTVRPISGNLAPRGGAKQYHDSCSLTLFFENNESPGKSGAGYQQLKSEFSSIFLVARTALDHWCWKIIL